jgi:hypothetical protein
VIVVDASAIVEVLLRMPAAKVIEQDLFDRRERCTPKSAGAGLKAGRLCPQLGLSGIRT